MEHKLQKPLSNFDLLGQIAKDMKMRGNIFDLRDINKAHNIEDIFKGRGHAILFEESEDPNDPVGHWTCLVRNKGGAVYFDSYGSKLSDSRLKSILKTKYPQIQFNPHQFQDYGKSAVCGRYALLCVGLNKIIPDLNVKHIVDFLKEAKPKNQTYDKFVVSLTKEL